MTAPMTPPVIPPTRAPVFEVSLLVVVDILCGTKEIMCVVIKIRDDQVLGILSTVTVASAGDFVFITNCLELHDCEDHII